LSKLDSRDSRLVWKISETGILKPVPIQIGITDGQNTEVLQGSLEEGNQVVIDAVDRSGKSLNNETATIQQRRRRRPHL
ncbi:MAG: hypothetical protein SVW57_05595, partial [Thermodesulfobacteriota bacterium]|nr:hypothetical protein [Thermodesulfobacteriota bacterium]